MAVEQLVKETGSPGYFRIFLAATGMSAIKAAKGKICRNYKHLSNKAKYIHFKISVFQSAVSQ